MVEASGDLTETPSEFVLTRKLGIQLRDTCPDEVPEKSEIVGFGGTLLKVGVTRLMLTVRLGFFLNLS